MNYKDEVEKILDKHSKMSYWEMAKAFGYSASVNPISTFQLFNMENKKVKKPNQRENSSLTFSHLSPMSDSFSAA